MLHDAGVDAQSDTCFSVGVPQRRSKKNPDMDKELDLLLGEIEKAWRGDDPTKSLRGLVFKGKEKGIVPESTWHTWRSGVAIPSLLELRRVAKAVGLLDADHRRSCPGAGETRIRPPSGATAAPTASYEHRPQDDRCSHAPSLTGRPSRNQP